MISHRDPAKQRVDISMAFRDMDDFHVFSVIAEENDIGSAHDAADVRAQFGPCLSEHSGEQSDLTTSRADSVDNSESDLCTRFGSQVVEDLVEIAPPT